MPSISRRKDLERPDATVATPAGHLRVWFDGSDLHAATDRHATNPQHGEEPTADQVIVIHRVPAR